MTRVKHAHIWGVTVDFFYILALINARACAHWPQRQLCFFHSQIHAQFIKVKFFQCQYIEYKQRRILFFLNLSQCNPIAGVLKVVIFNRMSLLSKSVPIITKILWFDLLLSQCHYIEHWTTRN